MNENVDRVLAVLDGFRMAEEMTYAAYSRLYDSICELDDLLKAQEPRVMTLEDVKTAEDCMEPVFLEMLDENGLSGETPDIFSWRFVKRIIPAIVGNIYMLMNYGFNSALWPETYGITWRCWTARPTDEQREAVKWE